MRCIFPLEYIESEGQGRDKTLCNLIESLVGFEMKLDLYISDLRTQIFSKIFTLPSSEKLCNSIRFEQ